MLLFFYLVFAKYWRMVIAWVADLVFMTLGCDNAPVLYEEPGRVGSTKPIT